MSWADLLNLLVNGSWGRSWSKFKKFDKERVILFIFLFNF